MDTKTYKGKTMLEALELVQKEMGPDAVVLSVREVAGPAWNLRKQSTVEVRAAPAGTHIKPKQLAAAPASPIAEQLVLTDDASAVEWIADEAPVRSQKLPQPILKSAPDAEPPLKIKPGSAPVPEAAETGLPSSLLDLKQTLADQELDAAFLSHIITAAADSLSPAVLKSPDQCRKYLSKVMESRLRLSEVRLQNPPAKLVCLVGMSGAGKTTMACRLAMTYGAQAGKQVTWICADVTRTGAIVEARIYTDAMNLPLSVVYTPAELKQAVADAAGSDLVIVDLPGYNPLDEDQISELGGLLTEIPDRCLLLVASASQKETDLIQAAASFGVFGLDGLAVTKLDETATFGSIFNVAMKTGVPLTYFSSGKGADGSLEAASVDRLVRALFGKGRM
jgi:flagellar biosynthesis protein FlhF